jgi:8-amino-7-oxononanoate synthase
VRRALAGRDEPAAFVVSDAVFSVDGGQAPVAELHAVARDHGALLVIDEAHSFGVIGPGGAVLAAPEVIGTLVDTGRGFIFDTGLAPPCAGAALAALEVIEAEPELGARARTAASGRPRSQSVRRACGWPGPA